MSKTTSPVTVKIPQHNTPEGFWCRFSGCDSTSGICRMCEEIVLDPETEDFYKIEKQD